MVNVNVMGYLYRVSDANWRRFLVARASENDTLSGAAGDYLGRDLGQIVNVTDMTRTEAMEQLAELREKRKT